MAIATLYVLHGIVTPSNTYSQISDARVATGCEILTAVPAGHPHPLFRAVASQKPSVEFSTTQLSTLLSEFTLAGVNMSAGNCDLYEKKAAPFSTRVADATTQHTRYRMVEAFGFIQSISASHQGQATAQARIIPIYDGTNEPIVPAGGSVALAGTPSSLLHWGAGPIEINGTALNGVQQVDIDFGVSLFQAGGETEIWDTFVGIMEIVPRITITTFEALNWATYGLDGTALSSSGLELWLRKKAADGTNVANGTGEHIKFTATNGIVVPEENSAGGNRQVSSRLVVYPRAADATSHSITVSTSATIA